MTTKPMVMLSESDVQHWPFKDREKVDDPNFVQDHKRVNEEERGAYNRLVAKIQERMSPPGALGLNETLERKRFELGIIDRFFTQETAVFDKVYLFQIPFRETHLGTEHILMPDITRERMMRDSPRALILSAGAYAQDVLRTNGIRVGDTITFQAHCPYRVTVDWIDGEAQVLFVLPVQAISGCEELRGRLESGEVRYDVNPVTNRTELVWSEERLVPLTANQEMTDGI